MVRVCGLTPKVYLTEGLYQSTGVMVLRLFQLKRNSAEPNSECLTLATLTLFFTKDYS